MIGQLTGIVTYCLKNPIILTVSGVGFEVHLCPKTHGGLTEGSKITLHTHTHVREDALELFGFSSRDDLELFHQLLTVSGIGPKTALLVIDRGSQAIRNAIIKTDVDFFTTIPRLGKKNAQKIIIELKNKLGSIMEFDLSGENNGETQQLIEALTGMGFAKSEVISTIRNITFDSGETLAGKIRLVLQLFGKNK